MNRSDIRIPLAMCAAFVAFAAQAAVFDDKPERPFRNLRFDDVQLEGETSPRVVNGTGSTYPCLIWGAGGIIRKISPQKKGD